MTKSRSQIDLVIMLLSKRNFFSIKYNLFDFIVKVYLSQSPLNYLLNFKIENLIRIK